MDTLSTDYELLPPLTKPIDSIAEKIYGVIDLFDKDTLVTNDSGDDELYYEYTQASWGGDSTALRLMFTKTLHENGARSVSVHLHFANTVKIFFFSTHTVNDMFDDEEADNYPFVSGSIREHAVDSSSNDARLITDRDLEELADIYEIVSYDLQRQQIKAKIQAALANSSLPFDQELYPVNDLRVDELRYWVSA